MSQIAASYERVSTRLQGQTGFSLGAQGKDVVQFAAANNWDLPEDLRFRDGEDRAASGADWELPGLNAMLDAAQQRRFTILVVPTVDRFARDMGKALVLENQLRKYGVRVVYINAPIEDSAEGRLLLRQLQSFAEFEREKIAFRTTRGRREKIERGQVLGNGPAPYGYRYARVDQGNSARKRVVGLEIDPLCAPVVERIFELARRCSSMQIVDRLRTEGVPPPRGYDRRTPALRWARDVIDRILTHPVYAGRMIYGYHRGGRKRANVIDDASGIAVPAIIDRQLFDDVQQAMQKRRKRRRARSTIDPFVLRGLLSCGHCGGNLSIKWNRVGVSVAERAEGKRSREPYRQYVCLRTEPTRARRNGHPVCSLRAVRAEHIEDAIWRVVHDVLMSPAALQSSVEAARARFEAATSRRSERIDIADREISRLVAQIERVIDELLETPKGTESYRALIERQRRIEDTLLRLRAERTNLEAQPAEGISQVAVDELAEFSRAVAQGLERGSAAERRWVFEQLRVEARVRMDPEGIRFGRLNYRFGVELDAIVQLDAVSSAGLSLDSPALWLACESGLDVRLRVVGKPKPVAGLVPSW